MRQHRPATEKPTAIIEASTSLMTRTNFSYGTSFVAARRDSDDFSTFSSSLCFSAFVSVPIFFEKIERSAQSARETIIMVVTLEINFFSVNTNFKLSLFDSLIFNFCRILSTWKLKWFVRFICQKFIKSFL